MEWFVVIVVLVGIVLAVVITKDPKGLFPVRNPTEYDAETVSTEGSPSEVTPTPSPPGDEKTEPSCFAIGC